jgi:hypothetical protein
MNSTIRRTLLGLACLALAAPAFGQEKATAQPGQPVNITVTSITPPPDVSLNLHKRTAVATPSRKGCTRTGGGNIDVQQPSPDTIVVTMSGVAVAYGSPAGPAQAALDFALTQGFEVSFDKPTVKAAKLTMEARVIGFLRAEKSGSAEQSGSAAVSGEGCAGLSIIVPSHAVSCGQSLSINDNEGPASMIVGAGPLCLTQSFHVAASMPKSILPCKAPSAEFAPDPALDPLWISAKEPFHGAKKSDLGFQLTIKVAPTDVPEVKLIK